jgi:hypothetical protein
MHENKICSTVILENLIHQDSGDDKRPTGIVTEWDIVRLI